MTIIIPKREPELVEAEAKQHWRGDTEKVPTTSLRGLTVRGVEITSRYSKADEYDLMQKVLFALPESLTLQIRSIFCDSKAGNCFSVLLRNWNEALAREIGAQIEAILLNLKSGHNGIDVAAISPHDPDSMFGDMQRRIYIDPNWGDAYDDY